MKCQILFPRKTKKNITNLSSAESAHSVLSVKVPIEWFVYILTLDNFVSIIETKLYSPLEFELSRLNCSFHFSFSNMSTHKGHLSHPKCTTTFTLSCNLSENLNIPIQLHRNLPEKKAALSSLI